MSHYKSKQTASRAANALAERLGEKIGGQWTPRVHENLGWHAGAILGAVSVSIYPYADGNKYMVLVSDTCKYPGTGNPEWSVGRDRMFDNPEDAVREGLSAALGGMCEMLNWVFDNTLAKMKRRGVSTTAAVLQIELKETIQELNK